MNTEDLTLGQIVTTGELYDWVERNLDSNLPDYGRGVIYSHLTKYERKLTDLLTDGDFQNILILHEGDELYHIAIYGNGFDLRYVGPAKDSLMLCLHPGMFPEFMTMMREQGFSAL